LHGGQSGEQLVEAVRRICPDFAVMTFRMGAGGIMGRPASIY
jgi:hypothetical protein